MNWSSVAAAALGFAVPASVAFADGGVFPTTWRLATLALCCVAAAALLARPRLAVARLEWAVAAVLAAFATWLALSAFWSGSPTVSLLQAERAVAYPVAILAVIVATDRRTVPALLGGLVAGIALPAAYGLTRYVVDPPPLDPYEGRLLYEPLGYANALGIFATVGILISAGLAVRARGMAVRAAALVPLAVLVPTLYLTSSRGAWLALAVAVPVLLLGGHLGRRAVVVAAAMVVAIAGAMVATASSDGVLDVVSEARAEHWEAASKTFLDHPFLGAGAGGFTDYQLGEGESLRFSRTAHSLYVQSLAELGPIGLLMIVTAVGLPLARLRRGDPVVAAAGSGYVAFAFHAGIDWDWEVLAVGVVGTFCAAAMLVATRPAAPAEVRPRARVMLLVTVLALAALALVRLASGPRLPFDA